ncbi:MAG: NAD-binding protein [Candidatus Micrarchaeia archaeon]
MAASGLYEGMTPRIVLLLVVIIILVFFTSVFYIYRITGNRYTATYFTLSALFDYSSITGSSNINLNILQNTNEFDIMFIISAIDGLSKAALVGFVMAAFINALMVLDIGAKMGRVTARSIRDHVVICGYSQLSERLCNDLKKHGIKFVIIEKSQEKSDLLADLGYRVVVGDFTRDEDLKKANIEKARTIVFASDNEYINLLGIVTARHLYPNLQIISKAKEELTITKMQRGGADVCIIPEVIAGIDIGSTVIKHVV